MDNTTVPIKLKYWTPTRRLIWPLVIGLLLGGGWYKARENRLDNERQQAWRERMAQLHIDGKAEWERQGSMLKGMYDEPDARNVIQSQLGHVAPFQWRSAGDYEIAEWRHPEYGIHYEFEFDGQKLKSYRGGWGTGSLHSVQTQPPQISRTSMAEAVRRAVLRWGVWLWLAAFVVAIASRRFGLAATDVMLATATACGIAWLVAPSYTVSIRGIFSNDPLVLAVLMLVVSVIQSAFRVAAVAPATVMMLRPQFRLRTLLMITAAIAGLLTLGPVGAVVILTLPVLIGLFLLALSLALDWRAFYETGRSPGHAVQHSQKQLLD